MHNFENSIDKEFHLDQLEQIFKNFFHVDLRRYRFNVYHNHFNIYFNTC